MTEGHYVFKTGISVNAFKITIFISNSEGIYGSTDFAKSRILQEGGKTIEALF